MALGNWLGFTERDLLAHMVDDFDHSSLQAQTKTLSSVMNVLMAAKCSLEKYSQRGI